MSFILSDWKSAIESYRHIIYLLCNLVILHVEVGPVPDLFNSHEPVLLEVQSCFVLFAGLSSERLAEWTQGTVC
jgi:hypothetical protein